MKKTRYTTISGMVSALSVVIMLLTNIMPSMMYVIPIITGAIVFAVNEIIGKKWALGVFFVTSFISFNRQRVGTQLHVVFRVLSTFKTII